MLPGVETIAPTSDEPSFRDCIPQTCFSIQPLEVLLVMGSSRARYTNRCIDLEASLLIIVSLSSC